MSFHFPEPYRIVNGEYGTNFFEHGNNGMGLYPRGVGLEPLRFIASDGSGMPEGELKWEHVSVSLPRRCPTWEEMCRIKDLFWDPEDLVVQLHPPQSQWVNNHPYCLHLWRPVGGWNIPLPPQRLVGYPSLGVLPTP